MNHFQSNPKISKSIIDDNGTYIKVDLKKNVSKQDVKDDSEYDEDDDD